MTCLLLLQGKVNDNRYKKVEKYVFEAEPRAQSALVLRLLLFKELFPHP
jgi:hypothetical protein